MATPSFNGATIFGIGYSSRAVANPARLQWDSFNGVPGRLCVNHGSEGVRVEFHFLQTASDIDTLGAYENIFLDLVANATVGTLVDTLGRTVEDARLIAFEPLTEVEPGAFGAVSREYRCYFECG